MHQTKTKHFIGKLFARPIDFTGHEGHHVGSKSPLSVLHGDKGVAGRNRGERYFPAWASLIFFTKRKQKNRASGQTWFEELEVPEPPLPTPASLKASAAPDHSILRSRHPDMDMASSIKLSPSLVPLKLKCLKL